MNITIEAAKCCGAGQCVFLAPTVFDQDDAGIAFLLQARPHEDERTAIEDAIASCPTGAIVRSDD